MLKLKRAAAVFLGLTFLSAGALAAADIFPLSQVKPGLKGKGRTVLQGAAAMEFDVEILGVLRNVQPKRSIILARLSGLGLDTTGVIGGMSGSPVYIDGKLVGAVAYGFQFSKEPITGLTPIEEMMAIEKTPVPAASSSQRRPPLTSGLTHYDLLELYSSELKSRAGLAAPGQALAPLAVPLVFNGFTPWVFDRARDFFKPLGFEPVLGGTGSLSQVNLTQPPALESLKEGDAVGVQLIGGDLDLSAVGTVTSVNGNRILAFGHPVYNLGAVEYAMTRAEVIAVMPSLESSFKLAAAGPVIGSFIQDRTSGVLGETGRIPRMVPVNLNLTLSPTVSREFKLKVVADKFLTPALLNLAVSTLVTSEQRSYGNLSLDFDGTVYLDDGLSVRLEDLFSGNYDGAATSLSGLVAAVVYYLTNNEFRDVGLFRIDLNVRAVEEARFCALEKVLLDKYEVSPGEQVQVKVYYRTFREESRVEEVTLVVPPLPAGTEFQLVVGDSATMQQMERSQYRVQEFTPRSFSQLVRLLGNLRKNNRIYFKVVAPKPGIFLKGEEMPNLPATLKSMFTSARASSSAPVELSRSTLSEYQLPVPYVFRGGAVIPVRIRK